MDQSRVEINMLLRKKHYTIYLYRAIIIFGGVFLLLSTYSTFQTIKFTLGIALIIGAIVGFLSAFSSKRKQVAFLYHEIHALAMLVYGISVLLFVNTLETLTNFSAFLFFSMHFQKLYFAIGFST